jgi:magnesium chelatase family protein
VLRYQGRLSGPLLDRIDIQVEVPSVKAAELMGAPDGEASAAIAARVHAARARQQDRQGVTNAELPVAELERHGTLDATSRDLLQRAAVHLGWSGRGLHRVQKLARTIADLHGSDNIRSIHIAEAMQWRRALPQA